MLGDDLGAADLARARSAIRRIHRERFRGQVPLSDDECDLAIEKSGPAVLQALIQTGKDGA